MPSTKRNFLHHLLIIITALGTAAFCPTKKQNHQRSQSSLYPFFSSVGDTSTALAAESFPTMEGSGDNQNKESQSAKNNNNDIQKQRQRQITRPIQPITNFHKSSSLSKSFLTLSGHADGITTVQMPAIGVGTWSPTDSSNDIGDAVFTALKIGYRHIDCAEKYGNEKQIGQALKKAYDTLDSLKRKDVFLTSKVWNTNHGEYVRQSCLQTLKNLGTDYLDLYLVHWPIAFPHCGLDAPSFGGTGGFPRDEEHGTIALQNLQREDENGDLLPLPSLQQTWEAMEALVDDGLVRAIGVSNVGVAQLCDVLTYSRHRPSVNQVELHPRLKQSGLVEFCHAVGTHIVAYSPLGRPGQVQKGSSSSKRKELNEESSDGTSFVPLLQDPCILEVAQESGLSPAQVLLTWGIQSGHGVIPKSSNPCRLEENLKSIEVTLSDANMQKIDSIEDKAGGSERYVNIRLVGDQCGPPFRQWGATLLE